MMIRMTMNITMRMSVNNCVYGVTIMMMIMIMVMCYRSVVLFIPFGMIVLALTISCCSPARRRLSRRLRMISSGTTVMPVSEWLGQLKCSATPDFSLFGG